MSETTQYRITVDKSPRYYVMNWDGSSWTWTQRPSKALTCDRASAEVIGNLIAQKMVAGGYAGPAKTLRVRPAGGGHETGWRPTIAEALAS